MKDFGFPYVQHSGFGAGDLSPAHTQLWKRATALVGTIPNTWPLRCHELARALQRVLVSTLPLHLQDGQLGSQDHSWLWVYHSIGY